MQFSNLDTLKLDGKKLKLFNIYAQLTWDRMKCVS